MALKITGHLPMKISGHLDVDQIAVIHIIKIKEGRGLKRPRVEVRLEPAGKPAEQYSLGKNDHIIISAHIDLKPQTCRECGSARITNGDPAQGRC